MEKRGKLILTGVKEYIFISFGLALYAIGWSLFLIPNGLVGGGVTGISAVIYYITGIQISYSFFVINVILLAIALKVLGKAFGVKTVVGVVLVTIFLRLLPDIIPQEFIEDIAIGNGKLLSAIMGGICTGAGIAITFTQGGSTGGTDIIALMISKYRNISAGKLILMMDVIIIASSLLIPSGESVGNRLAIILYGFILITVTSYSLDLILSGMRQSQQVFIFSRNYETIADKITTLGRGVTVIEGTGWYTKKTGKILLVIVKKSEINHIFKMIREIDRDAFLSVGNVMGVYGKGFDQIKK
jgi:Uncharacterized conserved protein